MQTTYLSNIKLANTNITLTEAGRNLGPGFGQGEKRGGVKPVNGTSIPFIIWRFPLAKQKVMKI